MDTTLVTTLVTAVAYAIEIIGCAIAVGIAIWAADGFPAFWKKKE